MFIWPEISPGQKGACVTPRCTRWLTCIIQHLCWSSSFRWFANSLLPGCICRQTQTRGDQENSSKRNTSLLFLLSLTPVSHFLSKSQKAVSKVRQWYTLCISTCPDLWIYLHTHMFVSVTQWTAKPLLPLLATLTSKTCHCLAQKAELHSAVKLISITFH